MVARTITHRPEPLAAPLPKKHAIFAKCGEIAQQSEFRALELRKSTPISGHAAQEAFIRLLRRIRARTRHPTIATQCRTSADLALSAHAIGAGGLQLPSRANLLGLWRRSDRAVRAVGGRMDDAGAFAALPSLRHVRPRSGAEQSAIRRAMVSALALRPLARGQRTLKKPHRSDYLLQRFQVKCALLR